MYDIRQFKPAMYCLVLLSITGFCLAIESPPLWLLAVSAVLFNAWLVRRKKFRPMPRFLSNLVTIGSMLYVVHEVLSFGGTAVLYIGEFLMLLQVIKIWEQRGNRDYAQLLVLSLLLMVAAAISTATLMFGLTLIVFLFLSLYCCLLFHLKVETDAARAAINAPTRSVSPAVLKQDQRHLNRSMRRLTMVVSIVSIAFAVIVFVFFPRGAGAGLVGSTRYKPSQSLVGFSEDVSFQSIARIQQNDSQAGYVKLTHNGVPVSGGSLLLRGVVLDTYTGKAGGWRWVRWPRTSSERRRSTALPTLDSDDARELEERYLHGETAPGAGPQVLALNPITAAPRDAYVQDITMLPGGTDVLFAMAGAHSIESSQNISYSYSPRDGELRNTSIPEHDRRPTETRYRVVSTDVLPPAPPYVLSGTNVASISPEIRQFALRPEVCGSDEKGSLAAQRLARFQKGADVAPAQADGLEMAAADELDETIATNIATYLRNNFAYTLDLTDTRMIEGRDPMVGFLYDFKKGHCEYFAGAMTLMCQSLGMKARMCAGFRCDEYNSTPGAGYFMVRQSHAHVWVEVFTRDGWKSFDPTSDRDSREQARRTGLILRLRHLLNFLEFSYGNTIIAYNNDDRSNLLQSTEAAMLTATMRSTMRVNRFRRLQFNQWVSSGKWDSITAVALGVVLALVALAIVASVINFLWQRWRLRKRAARIGINALPREEQVRLARQLRFYDDLLQLLGKHRIQRRPHQTPLEFSQSLLFLPASAYDTVSRLTGVFYKVRYGNAELSSPRQKRLHRVIQQLSAELDVQPAAQGG